MLKEVNIAKLLRQILSYSECRAKKASQKIWTHSKSKLIKIYNSKSMLPILSDPSMVKHSTAIKVTKSLHSCYSYWSKILEINSIPFAVIMLRKVNFRIFISDTYISYDRSSYILSSNRFSNFQVFIILFTSWLPVSKFIYVNLF